MITLSLGHDKQEKLEAVEGGRNWWLPSPLSLRMYHPVWVDPRHSALIVPIGYVYVPYLYVG
jgi:hypothetical protein